MPEKQENFTLLDGRVKMKRSIYNPTSDAVWLAAFAPTSPKKVLDVGIGTGGVSLCLLTHNPNADITGVDISSEMLIKCAENASLNNAPIKLIGQDITKWSTPETFELVVTNPPYFNGTPAKHDAHHNVDLTKWIKKCCARVKPGGYFCAIIDSLCLSTVIAALDDKHFGDIQIFPLFSTKNTAERVLVRGRQGVKTGSTLFAGTSMNNDKILRSGLTIDAILSTLETL